MLKSLKRNEQLKATVVGVASVALCVVLLAAILPIHNYMPHAICWRGDERLIWSLALSNLTIFASYMVLSAALLRMLFQVNLGPLAPIAAMFGFFILTCGLTHIVDVIMIWYGAFWLQAIMSVMCAIPSVATAVYVFRHAGDILELSRTIFMVYGKEHSGD